MEIYIIENWIEDEQKNYCKIWDASPKVFTSKNKANKSLTAYLKVEKELYNKDYELIETTDYYKMYAHNVKDGFKEVIKLTTTRTI